MKTTARVSMFLLALVAIAVVAAPVAADPWPGEWPKFQQLPMIETKINDIVYYGHDEESTARSLGGFYFGMFMADDFADTVDNDVVHVTWWGSYMSPAGAQGNVRSFLIAFEDDIPAEYDDLGNLLAPSRPGNVMNAQVVTRGPAFEPGRFTETAEIYETAVPPEEMVYRYNAELARPFDQQADTVYWLKIVALVDEDQPDLTWGWHNRDYTIEDPYASTAVSPGETEVGRIPNSDPIGLEPTPIYHFQDDAVTGQVMVSWDSVNPDYVEVAQEFWYETYYKNDYDGPSMVPEDPAFPGIGVYSKDLAFVLHAVPEPSTLVLLALGLACLAGCRWRKK